MKQLAINLIAYSLSLVGYAQTIRSPLNSAYHSAGVYSINFSDVFAVSTNPACLSQINSIQAGIYAEQKFMLKELAYYQAIMALPSKKGGFSLTMHYSGSISFSEMQLGIGYGRKLSEKIDLGARINYNHLSAGVYGDASAIIAEIGAIWHLSEQVHVGMHVYNPIGGKYGKTRDEKIPSIYRSGIGYEVSEKVFLSTELVKEEDRTTNINVAIHYQFIEQFLLKAGLSTANGQFFAGAGLRWNKLQIDIISSWHQPLGFTPSIVFIFGKYQKGGE